MIQLIEEKDPAYPQESQLRALLSDGASPSYLGEYKCAYCIFAPLLCSILFI